MTEWSQWSGGEQEMKTSFQLSHSCHVAVNSCQGKHPDLHRLKHLFHKCVHLFLRKAKLILQHYYAFRPRGKLNFRSVFFIGFTLLALFVLLAYFIADLDAAFLSQETILFPSDRVGFPFHRIVTAWDLCCILILQLPRACFMVSTLRYSCVFRNSNLFSENISVKKWRTDAILYLSLHRSSAVHRTWRK